MKRIVTIVGARPQFIKAAVVSRLIRSDFSDRFSEYLVHTGQHYDDNMSDLFFRQLAIPTPDQNLGVGSGTHAEMTAQMLVGIERVLLEQQPDIVLVYGDTNSTLAAALAAAKLHIPVAHVEAGLRSFNRHMPEEHNRVLTDHVATYLFCPTETAREHLKREGVTEGVHVVGDVMLDAALYYKAYASSHETLHGVNLAKPFALLTLHRAENTDNAERLRQIVSGVNSCDNTSFVFPVHPRTRKKMAEQGLVLQQHVIQVEPVGYLEMVALEERCQFVITDSGGVQKEAYFYQKPCLTLRTETEWTETVETGWNTLVPADSKKISNAIASVSRPNEYPQLYGDGSAGTAILELLKGS